MAIRSSCPHCGASIDAEIPNADGRCPSCDRTINTPQTDVTPPEPHMSLPTDSVITLRRDTRRTGWARAALALGIAGFVLPLVGLAGALCGTIALLQIANRPDIYAGRRLAIKGIILGIAGTIIIALAIPSLIRQRELSRRRICAANLKGMGTGFYLGNGCENREEFPSPFEEKVELIPPSGIDYVGAIGSYRGKIGKPQAGDVRTIRPVPTKVSTTRCMWFLIRWQAATPRAFICPSSNDVANQESTLNDYWDFGVGDITGPATAEQVRQGWSQISYGIQVPFGKHGRPRVDCDQRMPLAAEKGPFSAALDGGLPPPPPLSADAASSDEQWRPWNSPNHGGQGHGAGQNVLFADDHVDWCTKPNVGMDNDNIYTQWAGKGTGILDRLRGNPPVPGGRQTPVGETDSLVYP